METKITVELVIEGIPSEAAGVVEDVLDHGVFQDAINDYAKDQDYSAKVLSAVIPNDEAEHARKRGTKIRESFLASVRANVNLLASMTAEERKQTLAIDHQNWWSSDAYARAKARALMVETWGQEAVSAALGGDK